MSRQIEILDPFLLKYEATDRPYASTKLPTSPHLINCGGGGKGGGGGAATNSVSDMLNMMYLMNMMENKAKTAQEENEAAAMEASQEATKKQRISRANASYLTSGAGAGDESINMKKTYLGVAT